MTDSQNSTNLLPKSNRDLLNVIDFCFEKEDVSFLFNNPEILSKIEQFLSYYTSAPQGPQAQPVPQSTQVTSLIDILQRRLINELSLSESIAKDNIMSEFFSNYPQKFEKLKFYDKKRSYGNIDDNLQLNKFTSQLFEEIVEFYYYERRLLIEVVLRIFDYAYTLIMKNPGSMKELAGYFITKHIFKTLWEQFKSYNTRPIRKMSSNSPSSMVNDMNLIQILKEQVKILDCMNVICSSRENIENEEIKNIIFNEMLNYFYNTKFLCYGFEHYEGLNHGEFNELINSISREMVYKSILFVIVTFQPEELLDDYINASNEQIKINTNLIPYANREVYKKFLQAQDFFPIKMLIQSIEMISEQNFIGSNKQYNYYQYEYEDAMNFFIAIINQYSNSAIMSHKAQNYFVLKIKYTIKQWLNLIMATIFESSYDKYPLCLKRLVNLVLDNPLSRDEFFNTDRDKKTPIYTLFEEYLNNHDGQNGMLIDMMIALSVQKQESPLNLFLFEKLAERNAQQNKSFLDVILDKWKRLNNELDPQIMGSFKSDFPQRGDFDDDVGLIKLFARLYSFNPSNNEMCSVAKRGIIEEQDQANDMKEFIMQSLITLSSLVQMNLERYNDYTGVISELLWLIINFVSSNWGDKVIIFLISKNEIIGNIISNIFLKDKNQKEYINSILCLKLISSMLSFENIILFALGQFSPHFIPELLKGVNSIIISYTKVNTLETVQEIKIIKEIAVLINKLINALLMGINREPISINVKKGKNDKGYKDIIHWVMLQIEKIDVNEFLFNFLRVKIFVDISQIAPKKNKFSFTNHFLDKLSRKATPEEKQYISSQIKKMLIEIFKCFSTICDLVTISTINESAIQYYSNMSIVKQWQYIFFQYKILPIFVSESNYPTNTYDINLIMLLFIYSNFEEDNDLYYESEDEDDDISEEEMQVSISDMLISKVKYAKQMNIASMAFCALTKIVYLLSLEKKNDTNIQSNISTNNNLLNYIFIKKNSNNDIEGNVSLFDKVKGNIILQLCGNEISLKKEIFKFISLCAIYQTQFTAALLEDFTLREVDDREFWGVIKRNFDDFENPSKNEVTLFGHLVIMIANILSNDQKYKTSLKNLLFQHKDFFSKFIITALSLFRLENQEGDDVEDFRRSKRILIPEIKNECSKIYIFNSNVCNSCFQYIIIKNICVIFIKLITLSDEKIKFHSDKHLSYDCFFSSSLLDFLKNQIITLLTRDSINFIVEDELNESDYSQNYTIVLKKLKQISLENDTNSLSEILGDIPFNYGYNFCFDLKEVYSSSQDGGKLFNYIEYNFILSLFHSKIQCLLNASYLIGLIFTIGPFGYAMGSSFFTNKDAYTTISQLQRSRSENIPHHIRIIMNQTPFHPKLEFNPLKDLYKNSPNALISSLTERLIQKIVKSIKDIIQSLPGGLIIKANSNPNSFICFQSLVYCYNILNFAFDYILYIIKINEVPIPCEFDYLLSLLRVTIEIFDSYWKKVGKKDTFLLSLISLLYSIITFFNIGKYKYKEEDISLINIIMFQLFECYKRIEEYRPLIMGIAIAYSSNGSLNINNTFDDKNSCFSQNFKEIIPKSISIPEYQSYIMFWINIVNKFNEQGLQLIEEYQVLQFLNANLSFINMDEYNSNERSTEQTLWCWMVKFLSVLFINIHLYNSHQSGIFDLAMNILGNNLQRIHTTLAKCKFLDYNNNSQILTIGLIEEVELITELIANILIISPIDFNRDIEQFLAYCCSEFLNMFNMFVPSIRISNNFKAISLYEKKMEEIKFDMDIKGENNIQKMIQEQPLLMQFEMKIGNYIGLNRNVFMKNSKSNLSNVFCFRIYTIFNRILFNITTGIVYYIKFIDNDDKKMMVLSSGNKEVLDERCRNVINALTYAINASEIVLKEEKEFEFMNGITNLFLNNGNLQSAIGLVNLISKQPNKEEFAKMNCYSFMQLIEIGIEMYKMFKVKNFNEQIKGMMQKFERCKMYEFSGGLYKKKFIEHVKLSLN